MPPFRRSRKIRNAVHIQKYDQKVKTEISKNQEKLENWYWAKSENWIVSELGNDQKVRTETSEKSKKRKWPKRENLYLGKLGNGQKVKTKSLENSVMLPYAEIWPKNENRNFEKHGKVGNGQKVKTETSEKSEKQKWPRSENLNFRKLVRVGKIGNGQKEKTKTLENSVMLPICRNMTEKRQPQLRKTLKYCSYAQMWSKGENLNFRILGKSECFPTSQPGPFIYWKLGRYTVH